MHIRSRIVLSLVALTLALALTRHVASAPADGPAKMVVKTESFDKDPGWEGMNNRVTPKELPTIVQDFGFSNTNHAGKAAGELGGTVTRASAPAFYAMKLGKKTLDDKLTASGTLSITKTTGGGGVFFGFFRAEQPGAGGRPIASLGMDIDTEQSGARLAVRMTNVKNQACGTFVTPFIPGHFRPTPIRHDGTRYTWKLEYDPRAADGRGRFTFEFHGDAPKPGELEKPDMPDDYRAEARRRFPSTTSFSVDLPEGFRQQETAFDHFGLMNLMKPGGHVSIYFDDLTCNGESQDFTQDPNWDASGNRQTYKATDVGGAHNFGYSETNLAGGKKGEIGGTFWRSDKWGYYADKVGPLSLEDRLEARGKVVLASGAPDADMCFGWFRAPAGDGAPDKVGEFVGIKVGGPTRVGHYFLPSFVLNEQERAKVEKGPVMPPGKVCDWSLLYDPTANGGNGAITVTLATESVTLNLKPGQKARAKEMRLDRFGMFATGPGGQIVRLYLDDITYTAGREMVR